MATPVLKALSPLRVLFQRREIPRLRSASLGMANRVRLVNIALVTLVALEFLNVFIGLINAFTALLLHDFSQRRIDILRHSLRVAAHEKVGALALEPFPNFCSIVVHLMLDINLLGLIARPCAIEACEKPFFLERLEFLAVGKIAPLMLRPKKEPVLSCCSGRSALLQIRAERRHSSSGANHDDWSSSVLRQVEVFCHTRKNGHRHVISAFRKKG